MADYVTNMIALKTRHSEVPPGMTVQEFCDLWNQRVPGMNLEPEMLSPSPSMRLTAKILMNSLWGKTFFTPVHCNGKIFREIL